MENKLTAKIRIHLFKNDKCFGPGICSLLEEVDKCRFPGARQAMDMNMSYSKAWKIVKQCEENLGFKLLISTTGGKSGGGCISYRRCKTDYKLLQYVLCRHRRIFLKASG